MVAWWVLIQNQNACFMRGYKVPTVIRLAQYPGPTKWRGVGMELAVGRRSACCLGPPKRTLVCECRDSHQTRRRRPDERGEFDTLRPSMPQEGDIAAHRWPTAKGCLGASTARSLPPLGRRDQLMRDNSHPVDWVRLSFPTCTTISSCASRCAGLGIGPAGCHLQAAADWAVPQNRHGAGRGIVSKS